MRLNDFRARESEEASGGELRAVFRGAMMLAISETGSTIAGVRPRGRRWRRDRGGAGSCRLPFAAQLISRTSGGRTFDHHNSGQLGRALGRWEDVPGAHLRRGLSYSSGIGTHWE